MTEEAFSKIPNKEVTPEEKVIYVYDTTSKDGLRRNYLARIGETTLGMSALQTPEMVAQGQTAHFKESCVGIRQSLQTSLNLLDYNNIQIGITDDIDIEKAHEYVRLYEEGPKTVYPVKFMDNVPV